jgi:hypothetical protein
MPKRAVDYVDSYVGSQTHGLKKLHGVLSRATLIGSRVPGPDWSTGAGSSFVICSATCVHRPAAPSCWTIRVRRVSFLSRVTNARGARLFPQSKSVIQTKQSDVVPSLLAAFFATCGACCLAGSDGVLLLRAHLCTPRWGITSDIANSYHYW